MIWLTMWWMQCTWHWVSYNSNSKCYVFTPQFYLGRTKSELLHQSSSNQDSQTLPVNDINKITENFRWKAWMALMWGEICREICSSSQVRACVLRSKQHQQPRISCNSVFKNLWGFVMSTLQFSIFILYLCMSVLGCYWEIKERLVSVIM